MKEFNFSISRFKTKQKQKIRKFVELICSSLTKTNLFQQLLLRKLLYTISYLHYLLSTLFTIHTIYTTYYPYYEHYLLSALSTLFPIHTIYTTYYLYYLPYFLSTVSTIFTIQIVKSESTLKLIIIGRRTVHYGLMKKSIRLTFQSINACNLFSTFWAVSIRAFEMRPVRRFVLKKSRERDESFRSGAFISLKSALSLYAMDAGGRWDRGRASSLALSITSDLYA